MEQTAVREFVLYQSKVLQAQSLGQYEPTTGIPMGVNFKNLNTVEQVSSGELEKLHTGSLMTRLQALRSMQESYQVSDWLPEERVAVEAAGLIAFKNSNLWKVAFSEVKAVLSQREHLHRGSKEKRQNLAQQKQNR